MTIGRRLNRAAKTRFLRSHPAPQQPPEGYVSVPDALLINFPSGFAPGEAVQAEAAWRMMTTEGASFRHLDRGNDYDLAARTKAARARRA